MLRPKRYNTSEYSYKEGSNSNSEYLNFLKPPSKYNLINNKHNNIISKSILNTKFGINKNNKEVANNNNISLSEFPTDDNIPESKEELINLILKLDKKLENNCRISDSDLKSIDAQIKNKELIVNELQNNINIYNTKISQIAKDLKIIESEINEIESKNPGAEFAGLSEAELQKLVTEYKNKYNAIQRSNQKIIFEKKLSLEKEYRKKLEKELYYKILDICKDSDNPDIKGYYIELLQLKDRIIN